jgi:hypothetical protein
VRSHTDGDSCGLVLVRERVNVLVFSRHTPRFHPTNSKPFQAAWNNVKLNCCAVLRLAVPWPSTQMGVRRQSLAKLRGTHRDSPTAVGLPHRRQR